MNKTETKKLTKLIEQRAQKGGILEFLQAGNTPSQSDLRQAGVADPKRVVNLLRADGHNIIGERVARRGQGTVTQYAFVAPVKAKTSKRSR